MRSRTVVFAAVMALLLAGTASAVSITPGVILNPTGSLAQFVWDCVYEDNKSAIVENTWIMVGGIKCTVDPSVALNVTVHGWYPDNKDQVGQPVFDFSTISHHDGGFTITFEDLIPESKYEIYKNGMKWKVIRTDDKGTLSFFDRVHCEERYVVKCLSVAHMTPTPTRSPPPIPPVPTPTKPIPGFEAVLAIAGLIGTAYLLGGGTGHEKNGN